jgi:hypothetical protein
LGRTVVTAILPQPVEVLGCDLSLSSIGWRRKLAEPLSRIAPMNPPPTPPRRGALFEVPVAGSPTGRGEEVGSGAGFRRGGAFLSVSPLLGPLPTRSSQGEDGEFDAVLVESVRWLMSGRFVQLSPLVRSARETPAAVFRARPRRTLPHRPKARGHKPARGHSVPGGPGLRVSGQRPGFH